MTACFEKNEPGGMQKLFLENIEKCAEDRGFWLTCCPDGYIISRQWPNGRTRFGGVQVSTGVPKPEKRAAVSQSALKGET